MSAAAVLVTALSLAEPGPLPDAIHFKTAELTFSRRYDYALRDGRIYWKLRQPEYGEAPPHWALLGPAGLPFQESGPRADDPKRIAAIAADATGLVAVADDQRVFDLQLEDLSRGKLSWYYLWGYPLRLLPDKVWLPRERRAWAYSLLNPDASYSEDVDGNPHTIFAVDCVFVLPPGGRELWFNDPWLPPNRFDFRIAGPERGAFAAVNVSASGSMVMVIDRRGRLYTRLVDFDSLGGNPGINYSFERRHFGFRAKGLGAFVRALIPMFTDLRSLPADWWHRQPDITGGKITRVITVLQTGEGNASRELRVQGTDAGGETGYWYKPVFAETWRFRATPGESIQEPFLDPDAPPEVVGSTDERCEGTVELERPRDELGAMRVSRLGPRTAAREWVPAVLSGFNVGWDPARIEVPAGAGQFVTLHFRPWSNPVRPGEPIRLLGTLELPRVDETATAAERAAWARLRERLGGRRLRQVYVYISDAEVRVEGDPFDVTQGVPAFRMRFARKPAPSPG